jgi:hypothetical protein
MLSVHFVEAQGPVFSFQRTGKFAHPETRRDSRGKAANYFEKFARRLLGCLSEWKPTRKSN